MANITATARRNNTPPQTMAKMMTSFAIGEPGGKVVAVGVVALH